MYDDSISQVSQKYPEEKTDMAVKLGSDFLLEYSNVMNEPIEDVEKCKKLGLYMYKLWGGATLEENPIAKDKVNSRLDALICFIDSL